MAISLSLSSSSLEQGLRLEQKLVLRNYDHTGQLELFSLHRIKNRINSMNIPKGAKEKLVEELIRENREYIITSGNDWRCITPTSLDTAVDKLIEYTTEKANLGIATIDNEQVRKAVKKRFNEEIEKQENTVKLWFYENYNELLYDTKGKIPYPIVRKMRDQLSQWAIEKTNPFSQPIDDLVEEVARSVGMNPEIYKNAEEIWEELKNYKKRD